MTKGIFFILLLIYFSYLQGQADPTAEFAGRILINTDSLSNTCIRARGKEALWFNGNYYSWGFGGDYNQFADPIHIGGASQPGLNVGLLIDRGLEVKGFSDLHDLEVQEEATFDKGLLSSDPVKLREAGSGPAGPELQFMQDNSLSVAAASIKLTNSTGGGNNRNLILRNDSPVGDITFILDGGTTHMRMSNSNVFSYVPLLPWITNTTDLGSTSKRWRTIYSQNALNTSDIRLKENINSLATVLPKIMKLQVKVYNYKSDNSNSQKTIGMIAQEVEKVDPNWVIAPKSENEFYLMNYNNISALAIKAIQEQQAIIEQQQATIKFISAELTSLKNVVFEKIASPKDIMVSK